MTVSLRDLEQQLAQLSRPEKAQLVQALVLDLAHTWPGVEQTPGVVGGDACIVRTRIPVWLLESYRKLGWSEARILENYPTLRAVDLVNSWAYAAAHREEIEQAIREHDDA